jgi:hypothetical protein
MDNPNNNILYHIVRIEKRLNEVYDRVADIKSDVNSLKWKVGAISSGISSAVTVLITWIIKYGKLP